MLHQLRAWFRHKYKLHNTDRIDPPPPYDCLSLTSRALTPLAQRDPAMAARYNASLSASAITARAIAEGPDAASAMDRALSLIHITVADLILAYGVSHNQPLVDSIWAEVFSSSEETARDIAQSPNPSYAIDRARRTEADLADGSADALALYIIDFIEARTDIRFRHRLSTEQTAHPKKGIAG